MAERILVVDDDPEVVALLVDDLEEAGYAAEGALSGGAAIERLHAEEVDLVVSDVEMPTMRGIDLVAAIHAFRPEQLVILMTAFGSVQLAVQCLRAGATDFVTKPFETEVLLVAIERAFRERRIRREIVRLRRRRADAAPGGLIARSKAMRQVVALAERAARSPSAVLLTGESGAGKSSVARFIHDQSPRKDGAFVVVNCAALPPALVESELFGSIRGAFTGAVASRPGLFREAHGGTLFLDEIGELPLEAQPKLLLALETRRVRPIGAEREIEADVRVIAATNTPLEQALRQRRFRPDLYYRLNVITIDVPPLRERPEDIEELVDAFLARVNDDHDRIVGIAGDAMRWLVSRPWPGNVRELYNVLERAVAFTDHDTIVLEDLRRGEAFAPSDPTLDLNGAVRPLVEIERAYIQHVLERAGGNVSEAARWLGIDRRTLQRRLREG
jgi:DNA-binding NtrC family response regulator